MITGKRAPQSRSRANELMGEAEQAVANQIKMEMLAGQKFPMPKKKEEKKCQAIKT